MVVHCPVPDVPRIVNDNVDPAKTLKRCISKLLWKLCRGYIPGTRKRSTSKSLNLAHAFFGLLGIQVIHHDSRARPREAQGSRLANTAPGSCHNCDLVG